MIGGQIPLLTTIIYVKYGKFGLESEEDVNRRCETFTGRQSCSALPAIVLGRLL